MLTLALYLQAKKRARSSRADFRIVTNVSGETTDIHILLYTCSTNLIDIRYVVCVCIFVPIYTYVCMNITEITSTVRTNSTSKRS